jgi:hypothetical protein
MTNSCPKVMIVPLIDSEPLYETVEFGFW